MKKIICLFTCLFLVTGFSFAKGKSNDSVLYEMPEIESENAYYIDLAEYGNPSVNGVEIILNVLNPNLFSIYGNNPATKKWLKVSQIQLRGFSDSDHDFFNIKIASTFRYFAVVPDENKKYSYNTVIHGKTIQIEVRGKDADFSEPALPKINLPHAKVFNIKKYGAEDYVIFQNETHNKDLTVVPYYLDWKTYKWTRSYESASMNGFGDTKKIEIINDEEIDHIVYMAFDIDPFDDYEFKMYEANDDLHVEIYDKKSNVDSVTSLKNEADLNAVDD